MPLAAPSANLSNRPSPTCAGHVAQTLSGRIEAILDGGPCAQGLESTVLNLTASAPQILRAGAINASDLEKILPEQPIMAPLLGQAAHVAQAQQSPGQLSRHYAPANTHCTLVNQEELETFWVTEKPMVLRQETAQAFEKNGFFRPKGAFTWLMPNDAAGYAQALYRTLYEIEKSQFEEVWIEGLAARSPTVLGGRYKTVGCAPPNNREKREYLTKPPCDEPPIYVKRLGTFAKRIDR